MTDLDRHEEVKMALTTCIRQAEGERVDVPVLEVRTGHIDKVEIPAFRYALEAYMEAWPMFDQDNHDKLTGLIAHLDSELYSSLLYVDMDEVSFIALEPEAYVFDDILEARDRVGLALAEGPAEFEAAVRAFVGMIEKYRAEANGQLAAV